MHATVRSIALSVGAVGLAAVVAPASAAPSGGTTTQVTVSPAGETDASGMGRYDPQISNDGRYVVFWSYSPTVVAGDNNNTSDVFLYDSTTRVTKLISRNAAGQPANGGSSTPVISANGKFIAFQSSASDLDVGVVPGIGELVYRYNVATGKVKLASKAHTGAVPTGWSINANISADGRYIAYTSAAHDIVRGDHNRVADVFRYDATTDTTIKVSQTLAGGETNKSSNSGWNGGISGDGRYVVYTAGASNMGAIDTNNDADAYIFDAQTGTTTLASPGTDGKAAGGTASGISDNGKVVSLWSASNHIVAGVTDKVTRAYVYNGNTNTVKLIAKTSAELPAGMQSTATGISANGRYITFDAITADGGAADVFLYDRTANTATKLSVTPSGGAANSASGCSGISRSGTYVGFCSTATNLVPGDPVGSTLDVFLWKRS